MTIETKPLRSWGIRLISAVVAVHVAICALIGAVYVFSPAALAAGEGGELAFVALAFIATVCGFPTLAMWVNGRMLWLFSKLLGNPQP